ncbi:hypothetical protein D3C85_1228460 [compost metagenome]
MPVKRPLERDLTIIGAQTSRDLDCFGRFATVEPPTAKRHVVLAQHYARVMRQVFRFFRMTEGFQISRRRAQTSPVRRNLTGNQSRIG